MSIKSKVIIGFFILLELVILGYIFLGNANLQLLNPKGPIAQAQRDLGFIVVAIMMVVAIPMTLSTFFIAYKFREHGMAKYDPDMKTSRSRVLLWWLIPTVIVLILATFIWKDTHRLDPYKPLESNIKPLIIQVVALQWKWLFIYPEQNIATVNYIQFPQDTPISFELTADAPMNSFWIPITFAKNASVFCLYSPWSTTNSFIFSL